jgi:putative flippase GtrA
MAKRGVDIFLYLSIVAVGLFIGLIPLHLTHNILQIKTVWMDNFSANVLGVALATACRFLMFNFYLYPKNTRE